MSIKNAFVNKVALSGPDRATIRKNSKLCNPQAQLFNQLFQMSSSWHLCFLKMGFAEVHKNSMLAIHMLLLYIWQLLLLLLLLLLLWIP